MNFCNVSSQRIQFFFRLRERKEKLFSRTGGNTEKCPDAEKRQGNKKSGLLVLCFFTFVFIQTRCAPDRKSGEPGEQNNQENDDRRTCEVKAEHCKKADNQGAGNDCENNIHKQIRVMKTNLHSYSSLFYNPMFPSRCFSAESYVVITFYHRKCNL